MSNILKNLLIALAISLILVFVYYFFIKDRLGQDEISTFDLQLPSGMSNEAVLEIERILADTQKINSYRIETNDDVLTSTAFTSLVDRRINIQDVPTGRSNPFAPVE
jgi:hypothetical protein